MLSSYHINLVKFKMLWLSKILGIAYNLGWREYFVTLTPCMLLSIKLVRITFYTDRMQQKSDPLHLLAWCLDEPLPVVPTLIFTSADLCYYAQGTHISCARFNWAIDWSGELETGTYMMHIAWCRSRSSCAAKLGWLAAPSLAGRPVAAPWLDRLEVDRSLHCMHGEYATFHFSCAGRESINAVKRNQGPSTRIISTRSLFNLGRAEGEVTLQLQVAMDGTN